MMFFCQLYQLFSQSNSTLNSLSDIPEDEGFIKGAKCLWLSNIKYNKNVLKI